MKGFVVAGTHSGCGKTTITLGLMAALRRRGLVVAPFKVGPDFIDPGHHTEIAGRQSHNLDGWMLSKEDNLEIFSRNTQDADIAVIEGVMGLFDGYDGRSEAGSTAQMAKWLGLPVVLVADVRSMARSAAALVQGFENFDPGLEFKGVIFNRVGSPSHLKYLRECLEGNVSMPLLGGLARDADIAVPERHLGLLTREDHALSPMFREKLADLIEKTVDIDSLINILPDMAPSSIPTAPSRPSVVRIGLAADRAFCFYYPENLEMLEACGAEIVRFSFLNDDTLPADIDGIYLGGGYPELHAGRISGNRRLKSQILEKWRQGMPVYGECGGFMVLCKSLVDLEGRKYPMVGCFDFTCRMTSGPPVLGYREIMLSEDTILGDAGTRIRGHEFHYSRLDDPRMKSVCRAVDRSQAARDVYGFKAGRCFAGYPHLHFRSRPSVARAFVQACVTYQCERKKLNEAR